MNLPTSELGLFPSQQKIKRAQAKRWGQGWARQTGQGTFWSSSLTTPLVSWKLCSSFLGPCHRSTLVITSEAHHLLYKQEVNCLWMKAFGHFDPEPDSQGVCQVSVLYSANNSKTIELERVLSFYKTQTSFIPHASIACYSGSDFEVGMRNWHYLRHREKKLLVRDHTVQEPRMPASKFCLPGLEPFWGDMCLVHSRSGPVQAGKVPRNLPPSSQRTLKVLPAEAQGSFKILASFFFSSVLVKETPS